eukprot:7051752-Prymnesium_polylepis.1
MDPCRECGGGDDQGLILLCDVCNGAVHASCNVPPFQGPLLGDWLCIECETPKPGRRMPLRRKLNGKTRRGVGKSSRGCRRRCAATSAAAQRDPECVSP